MGMETNKNPTPTDLKYSSKFCFPFSHILFFVQGLSYLFFNVNFLKRMYINNYIQKGAKISHNPTALWQDATIVLCFLAQI